MNTTDTAITKICTRCEEEKPLAEFSPSKRYAHGRNSRCRPCMRAYSSSRRARPKVRPESEKNCATCGRIRPVREFGINNINIDGLTRDCIFCRTEKHKPRPPGHARNYYLKKTYDMSLIEYNRIHAEQDGKCAICGNPQSVTRYSHLDVDHAHSSGAVRGLLCSPCNTALGLLKEDPIRMMRMVRYVTSHSLKQAIVERDEARDQAAH